MDDDGAASKSSPPIKPSPMVSINFRETIECKISTVISYLINQNYGRHVDAGQINESAEFLGIYRSDLCSNVCLNPRSASKATLVPDARDLLFKYFMQVEYLENRVPLLKDSFDFSWQVCSTYSSHSVIHYFVFVGRMLFKSLPLQRKIL